MSAFGVNRGRTTGSYLVALAPLVLVVAITPQAGGQGENYLSWAVFAALIIAGLLTALQATRLSRVGAGQAAHVPRRRRRLL